MKIKSTLFVMLIKTGAGILVAANLLLISAKSFAEPFEERLLSKLEIRNHAAYLATWALTDRLNQRLGVTFPADALDDKSYELLSVGVVGMAKRIEEFGENYRQASDDPTLKKQLNILVSTVLAVSDPKVTGVCSKLGIDLESAEKSKGDWRKVKANDNWKLAHQTAAPEIKPSSHLHTKLHGYYRVGCGGKKDFESARKVLFDISDLEPADLSKRNELRPEIRHCEAEIWARYGIGGPIDLVRAEQFSKRFTKAAFFFWDEDTPERRAELATQYPDAAKINFWCPHPEYYLDPRNPWKRLW